MLTETEKRERFADEREVCYPKYPVCAICKDDEYPMSSIMGMNICENCIEDSEATIEELVYQVRQLKNQIKNQLIYLKPALEKTILEEFNLERAAVDCINHRCDLAFIGGLLEDLIKESEGVK